MFASCLEVLRYINRIPLAESCFCLDKVVDVATIFRLHLCRSTVLKNIYFLHLRKHI
jgi:hypothetical protein